MAAAGTATTHVPRDVRFVHFALMTNYYLKLTQSVKAFYDFADKDRSGKLSAAEVQIAALLAFPSEKELVDSLVDTFVSRVDADHDGGVSVKELVDLCVRNNPAHC